MTTHTEKEDQFAVLYIYGELDPAEQEAFLSHLKICARCRALVGESERISRLIKCSAEDAPEKAAQALRRAAGINCRTVKGGIQARKLTWALPVIGFAFACAAVFIIFPRTHISVKNVNQRSIESGSHDSNMYAQAYLGKMMEISGKLDDLEAEVESFKEEVVSARLRRGDRNRGGKNI